MEQATIHRPAGRRQQRGRAGRPLLLVLGAALAIALALIGKLLLSGGAEEQPAAEKEPPETPDWVTQELLPVNAYSRPGTPLETVEGIVVHYIGNPGTTAEQNRKYFAGLAESGETYASSHFLIGLEGEILQCVPLDEIAYCSNSRNADTISIECCHPDETGAFTPETYEALVRLTQWLQDWYGLDGSQVIRHFDVTGKECPRYFVQNPEEWELFLEDLEAPVE